MKFENLEIKNGLFLAPMAGFSDVGFRKICADFGAGSTCTEMVSAKALIYDSKKTKELLHIDEEDKSVHAVQIFGHEPDIMADIVNYPELEKFDYIDINFGCPAPKINKNSDGCALMGKTALAAEIISKCALKSKKPVTVKIRKGIDEQNINAVDFAKMCEDSGAKMITVHGRTRKQGYSGNVDYEIIRKVKSAVKIPVIGNGDVRDLLTYKKMINMGVDGVMIGRGAVGSPWIFKILSGNTAESIFNHTPRLPSASTPLNLEGNYSTADNLLKHNRKSNYAADNLLNHIPRQTDVCHPSILEGNYVAADYFMHNKEEYCTADNNIFETVKSYIETMKKFHDERFIIINGRKHFLSFLKSREAKVELINLNTLEEVLELLKRNV